MAAPKILVEDIDVVPVGDLILHPENPKRGDVDLIAESIEAKGFWSVILVQRSTNYVLAGNHRLLAARNAGMDEVPVAYLDVDDETALAILLGDNRYSELGVWDDPLLLATLEKMPDLAGSGFTAADVDLLRESLNLDDPPKGDGRMPSADVRVQVGNITFTVPREHFDAWDARLTAEVGAHHDAKVEHLRGLLEI